MNAQVTPFEVVPPSTAAARFDSMTPRALMKAAHKAAENWTHASYELGAVLSRIKYRINVEKDKNFGYETFTEFVDAELKVKGAQAENFIRVYQTLTKKGIDYSKVAVLPFSVVLAALPVFTVENVDSVVLELEGKTYKEVVNLPEVKASKDKTKAKAGAASAASKKAAATVDDAQDVAFKETPATAPAPTLADYAALGEAITVEQLVALFESVSRDTLIKAFNSSGKKGVKLVVSEKPGPKAKAAPAA